MLSKAAFWKRKSISPKSPSWFLPDMSLAKIESRFISQGSGMELTGLEESASGTEWSPVGSPSPGPPQGYLFHWIIHDTTSATEWQRTYLLSKHGPHLLDWGGRSAIFIETRFIFEQHLTFIENKEKNVCPGSVEELGRVQGLLCWTKGTHQRDSCTFRRELDSGWNQQVHRRQWVTWFGCQAALGPGGHTQQEQKMSLG